MMTDMRNMTGNMPSGGRGMRGSSAKLLLCAAVFALFFALSGVPAYAIGEFAIGVNGGFTYDPNCLENTINRFNLEMEGYREDNAGADIQQMSVPYAPVFGFNLRYQFNFFLFRIGNHYSAPMQNITGSITASGAEKNTIRIKTYQNSFPATIGILVPLNRHTHFYVGAGPTLHLASVSITQSNPAPTGPPAFYFDSTNKRDRYTGTFVGYHFLVGAEIPVQDKFTFSVEWIHQEGRSQPIENDGVDKNDVEITTPMKSIQVRGDFILFGLNYYISF